MSPPRGDGGVISTNRYVRAVGVLGIMIVLAISVNTLFSTPKSSIGPDPGRPIPPFAVPLAAGTLSGDANVATAAHQGSAGNLPACSVRGPQILNICQLYERGPVALALIVNDPQCDGVLATLHLALPSYPGLQAAAVVIRGSRAGARRLALSPAGAGVQLGYDRDGALRAGFRLATCPQITFILPGGAVDGRPLLKTPTRAQLDARLSALYAGARARGWKPPPPAATARR
ncbi:MAG: hypothetical protein ACR2ND_00695 [Solirubrobacteraceae bacterium]